MVSYVHGDGSREDAIVTETYDKTLHLDDDAPTLLPPGEACSSLRDKKDSGSKEQ